MLDVRVRYMFQKQYTREPVSLDDIMPANHIDQRTAVEYIIDRTFLRPREASLFLNECIDRSEGSTRIKANVIKSSEVAYSQQRLRSLYDEWRVDFPALRCYVDVLKRRLGSFAVSDITDEDLERVGFALLNDERNADDPLYKVGERCFLSDDGSLEQFRKLLVRTLYQVGALGVKLEAYQA